jgi:transposase-like protein
MECPFCQSEARRFGRNRNGTERYQCLACRRTFTATEPQPLGRMRISPAKAIMCLRMLLEGSSIRTIERLTSVHRNTIVALLVLVGQRVSRR